MFDREHKWLFGGEKCAAAPPAPPPPLAPALSPPAPTPAPAYMPPPATTTCDRVDTELLHMTKTMPREVSLGEAFTFEIKVTAKDCVADVVVTDMLPEGPRPLPAVGGPRRVRGRSGSALRPGSV